jgi:hypothetical protein
MTFDWGRVVPFHANGADVGAADNLSLLYTWNFGDPTDPLGAAGQDVSHVYSQPGGYNVVGTAHDKDGATGNDNVQVTITKRNTSIAYTGPQQSLRNKFVTLSAQVTDEYGQAVPGKTVEFTLGSQTVSAITNGSGVAQATVKLADANGAYTLQASLLANDLYNVSSTTASFVIGNKV